VQLLKPYNLQIDKTQENKPISILSRSLSEICW